MLPYIFIVISFIDITVYATDSDSEPDASELVNSDSPWAPTAFLFPTESPLACCLATEESTPLQRNSEKRAIEIITLSSSSSSYSSSSSDSEEEPTSKYQKRAVHVQQEEACDIMHLGQPRVWQLVPLTIPEQLQMLRKRVEELSYAVAALKKQLPSESYLNLAPAISCDELLATWNETIPQFVRATPEDSLRITDEFLAALPREHNYKNHFFVQHIFLTKAQLWYDKYTMHLKHGYHSLPTYQSLQMRESLKHAHYYFNLVDPVLLNTHKLHPTKITAALHTHLQLGKQLLRAQQHILHNIDCAH